MIRYLSIDANLQSCEDIKSKIVKIDAIISALMDTALKVVLAGDTVEYTLDTGQTKISKVLSTPDSVMKAIKDFETLRVMYLNKISSRVVRIVDSKNILNGFYGR